MISFKFNVSSIETLVKCGEKNSKVIYCWLTFGHLTVNITYLQIERRDYKYDKPNVQMACIFINTAI